MNENLTHYMNGCSNDFQDFLEDPLCCENDKLDAMIDIGTYGWDECLEILVNRDDPILVSQVAAQAWVHMASNGHTDAWMQMVSPFYQEQSVHVERWRDALRVGRDDARLEGHWDVYALCNMLEEMVNLKTKCVW